jgi:hypothetical protein
MATAESVWRTITVAMTTWREVKLFIEHSLTVSHDTLHLLTGVLLWLVLARVLRRPITSILPWASVLILTLWTEAIDLWIDQWPSPGRQLGEGAKDVVLTLCLPSVLMLTARLWPDLFRQRSIDGRRS